LAFRVTLLTNDGERGAQSKPAAGDISKAAVPGVVTPLSTSFSAGSDHKAIEVHRALRHFHLLLRSERLYEKNHPCRLDSLDSAYSKFEWNAAESWFPTSGMAICRMPAERCNC